MIAATMALPTEGGRGELASRQLAPRPFLKWAGGKSRLCGELGAMLPPGAAAMRHVEPFVGGGAFFFWRRARRGVLSDINPDLIGTYVAVRDELDRVVAELEVLAAQHSTTAYYDARERYNRREGLSSARRAALFIYLNKTCFNGLHRVNRDGAFNVPCGRYARPAIVDRPTLVAASRSLQGVVLRWAPFERIAGLCGRGDFVYLDPPYVPLTATSNFASYAREGFGWNDHVRLRNVFRALSCQGAKLMLSNSDAPGVRELYREFHVTSVQASRAVSCDPAGRGKVTELVIRNYS